MKVYDLMFIGEYKFLDESKLVIGNSGESHYRINFMRAMGSKNTKNHLLIVLVEKDFELKQDEELTIEKIGRSYIVKNPIFIKKLLYCDMLVFDDYTVIEENKDE